MKSGNSVYLVINIGQVNIRPILIRFGFFGFQIEFQV